jgi:hypothetical protein
MKGEEGLRVRKGELIQAKAGLDKLDFYAI